MIGFITWALFEKRKSKQLERPFIYKKNTHTNIQFSKPSEPTPSQGTLVPLVLCSFVLTNGNRDGCVRLFWTIFNQSVLVTFIVVF